MNQIYINTKESEENRVIVVNNGKLIGYEQERVGEENRKGNIYKGIVTLVEGSLNAVFVDIGEEKKGLLPIREIPAAAIEGGVDNIKKGDCLLVQIKKDHMGDKGPGLTGYISLAGHYLVLQPNRKNATMISKQGRPDLRRKMQEIVGSLELPDNMSIIVRTAGLSAEKEQLIWDLESYLLKIWEVIKSVSDKINDPTLIYRENDLLLRNIRNYFRPSNGDKIYCDNMQNYEELSKFLALVFPDKSDSIIYHYDSEDMVPAKIEDQIDEIFSREISTPTGVRLVFDSTEALVAVDVNSGRLRAGADIEETALKANMEAAEVVALHLRLRNLAGLVVIDFIDMEAEANRTKLEQYFNQLLKYDRAHVRSSSISQFGLMEISRQRIARSLNSLQTTTCPHCVGTGQIWRSESFSTRMLRKVRSFAENSQGSTILLEIPMETSVYIMNERRSDMTSIEQENNCKFVIIPNDKILPPEFIVKKLGGNEKNKSSLHHLEKAKHEKIVKIRESMAPQQEQKKRESVIQTMLPASSAPQAQSNGGLLKRFMQFLSGGKKKPQPVASSYQKTQSGKKAPNKKYEADKRHKKHLNKGNKLKNERQPTSSQSPQMQTNSPPLQSNKGGQNSQRRRNKPEGKDNAQKLAPKNIHQETSHNAVEKPIEPIVPIVPIADKKVAENNKPDNQTKVGVKPTPNVADKPIQPAITQKNVKVSTKEANGGDKKMSESISLPPIYSEATKSAHSGTAEK